MKIARYVVFALIVAAAGLHAQVLKIDTLQYKGDIAMRINLVILGDGYTAAQQGSFKNDASNLRAYLFSQSPWSHYPDYFNVFAIEVISPESGAKHPKTASDCSTANPLVPVSNPNTFLGCSFDSYGIHRLLVPQNINNVADVLASNFPNYDQVFVISNTPYYGGSGGAAATASVESSSNEIVVHEIGHSFAYLADEYWAGPQYAIEKPNMTQESDSTLIRWTNWLKGGTGIGIHPFAEDPTWFKPSPVCRMQYLGVPYCSVCQEAIVEKIHSLTNPIAHYSPDSLSITASTNIIRLSLDTLIYPEPNSLLINWKWGDSTLAAKINQTFVLIDPSKLAAGTYQLSASVLDTTDLVRIDSHFTSHIHTVLWTIEKASSGGVMSVTSNAIALSIFPNPASNVVNVVLDLTRSDDVSIEIATLDGKSLRTSRGRAFGGTRFTDRLDISDLPRGAYAIICTVGSTTQRGLFVKE